MLLPPLAPLDMCSRHFRSRHLRASRPRSARAPRSRPSPLRAPQGRTGADRRPLWASLPPGSGPLWPMLLRLPVASARPGRGRAAPRPRLRWPASPARCLSQPRHSQSTPDGRAARETRTAPSAWLISARERIRARAARAAGQTGRPQNSNASSDDSPSCSRNPRPPRWLHPRRPARAGSEIAGS